MGQCRLQCCASPVSRAPRHSDAEGRAQTTDPISNPTSNRNVRSQPQRKRQFSKMPLPNQTRKLLALAPQTGLLSSKPSLCLSFGLSTSSTGLPQLLTFSGVVAMDSIISPSYMPLHQSHSGET